MTEPARHRILLVTRNLPPLVGGMERLNWHMAAELAKYADVRAIGPAGSALLAPESVAIEDVRLSPLPRFLINAQWKALCLARRWRPDLVLAGSGLTAPLAVLAAKACGAKAAVYVHGLDLTVQQAVYRSVWLPAIRRMDMVIANSQATRKLAIDAGVAAGRIGIVHPGVDLQTIDPDPQIAADFRARHQLGQHPVLLSVGRLSRRKGMREFVADVLPQIVAARPNVMLLIVGDAPKQALHAETQSRESIQAVADTHAVGGNIRFLGLISDGELEAVYRAADVHVFPVQHVPNDPEGFGMVALEAAAQGLPTVAYATGGVVDAVSERLSGRLIAPGDVDGMARAVLDTLDSGHALRASSMEFASAFAWPTFGDNLRLLLGMRHG
ncbi:MAG: glycosyltransferase family 4 protein [Dokdonella sp.]|uniref:glycosyltransferase family 4 protein n=1 Tax=Dokdonella sp. TaxID=2291710 RepID=UPI003266D950